MDPDVSTPLSYLECQLADMATVTWATDLPRTPVSSTLQALSLILPVSIHFSYIPDRRPILILQMV
jgi:hypothetical protein